MVYTEKFPNAFLQICLFHVLQTFRREITTVKRNITNIQREQVLELLQRLVYSQSAESYNVIYEELMQLKLEEVTQYYKDNWNCIREEWTLFGCNKQSNYMNGSNNSLESLNQKIKLIGNRHANLLTFFENLSITMTNLSSEKDLAAIRSTMKQPRMRFDPYLKQYAHFKFLLVYYMSACVHLQLYISMFCVLFHSVKNRHIPQDRISFSVGITIF